MNLIIDLGNTRLKAAVFEGNACVEVTVIPKEFQVEKIIALIKKYNCRHAIVAAVGGIDKDTFTKIERHIQLLYLDNSVSLPFKNSYATPKTLGVDRLALIAAAVSRYPKKSVLVIDAGTCITYDFIENGKTYRGGAISPGIKMRYRALNEFTDRLPLLEASDSHDLTGNSTAESIHSGVINGVISEINSSVEDYREKNKNLTVVLTGGDVYYLANKLKNGIFANPNFLFEGLNSILTYNLA